MTTFAGLSVAVVSVLLANYLEGRIERLLRLMEDLFVDLLPHLERFEGKLRVARSGLTDDAAGVQLRTRRPGAAAASQATGTEGGPHSTALTEKNGSQSQEPDRSPSDSADDTEFAEAVDATPDENERADGGQSSAFKIGVEIAGLGTPTRPGFSETEEQNVPLPPDKNKIDSPHGLWDIMWEHREARQVVERDDD